MPLRHSRRPDDLDLVEATLAARQRLRAGEDAVLARFQRASAKQRAAHAAPPPPGAAPGSSDDADILERPWVRDADEAALLAHPVTAAVRAFLKTATGPRETVLVSLSGGVDSMVLAKLLTAQCADFKHARVVAAHIDYRNRPESGAEAAFVQKWCAALGIECRVRVVTEVSPPWQREESDRPPPAHRPIARDLVACPPGPTTHFPRP